MCSCLIFSYSCTLLREVCCIRPKIILLDLDELCSEDSFGVEESSFDYWGSLILEFFFDICLIAGFSSFFSGMNSIEATWLAIELGDLGDCGSLIVMISCDTIIFYYFNVSFFCNGFSSSGCSKFSKLAISWNWNSTTLSCEYLSILLSSLLLNVLCESIGTWDFNGDCDFTSNVADPNDF